ncbi:glutamate--tRNA ligase [Candidatus Woesearchaeota archaeon]|nr:glutamate--tRNA ligase [Candidatus Woesearchaeota archaeon]
MDIEKEIRKFALQNAARFDGKANPGAVVGKVLNLDSKLRTKASEIGRKAAEVCAEVNKLTPEQQKEEIMQLDPSLLEEKPKQEKKRELPELKGAKKGKVVMRFAPSPSGPMHIGHAYAISLTSEYCRRYDGKLILRIEDTNPENIYKKAYDLLPEDARWLTKDRIHEVWIQSGRLGVYYDYAQKLVEMEKAYVCECDTDRFRKLVFEKKACPCRDIPKKEQVLRFEKMFSGYKAGEAVLRLKTDINHKNPAMRDFPLMRINEHKHPRQGTKHRVWPLMNLAVFVDDVEGCMTHIIRAKDHMDNAKRQEYLYRYFQKPVPESLFVGRLNFEGMPISCSKTRVLIEEGKYEGWDDIRLPFLLALRRRGYQPEAFINWAVDIGLSQADKTVTKKDFFKSLDAFNRDIVDPVANRYFFVWDPVKVRIKGAPSQKVELELHPDHPKRGKRKFKTGELFYLCKEDVDSMKDGMLNRLMDCLNLVKDRDKFKFDPTGYENFKEQGGRIIHWLPAKDVVKVEVHMPDEDRRVVKGYGEKKLEKLKQGDVVQLERFGFCRLDEKKKDKLVFWFGHR